MKCYKDLDLNKLSEVSGIDYVYFKKPDIDFSPENTYALFKNNGVNILDDIEPEDNLRDAFVIYKCGSDKVQKLCDELKNQLGDRYRVVVPKSSGESININFLGEYGK